MARRIGNYELCPDSFSRGAAGTLYVGRNSADPIDAAHVAVKLVRSSAVDLEQEAIRLYRSKNGVHYRESLMPITDHGWSDDQYYIVMPLADDLDGRSLRPPPVDYVPKSLALWLNRFPPLRPEVLLPFFDGLLVAVDHLHSENGLVHGDIKPANIVSLVEYCNDSGRPSRMVGGDNRWVLTDFTTLRRGGKGPVLGRGSPWFRPPEGAGDFQGDVYSLGKMLLLLVTNSAPPQINARGKLLGADPFELFKLGQLPFARTEYDENWTAEELKDLIIQVCDDDPQKRGTVDELRAQFRKCVPQKEHKLSSNPNEFEELSRILRRMGFNGFDGDP